MPLDGAQPADDSSRSGLRIDHRVLKVDALLLLAFKPDSEKARAEMPASIYTFYSREAVQRMLDASGFCAADTVDYAFAARRILFMVPAVPERMSTEKN
ncbi:MAG TPA: hypothetical protein VGQ61_08740 [Candidatus Angelobacter sp.]|jgi:hypothetical protein|nr:hypothetical protein [Candidatus Angelobacter sp.]